MSERTKSLVYREMVISKKFYTSILGVFLLFTSFCWLVRLSLEFGNLAKLAEDDDDIWKIFDMITFFLSAYFTSFVAGVLNSENGVVMSDVRSKWKMYSHTLPITPLQELTAKYIIKLFWIITSFLLCVLNSFLFCLASNRELTSDMIMIYIWFINIWLIADIIKTPLMLRANTEKEAARANTISNIIYIFIYIAALAGMFWLQDKVMNESNERLAAIQETMPELSDNQEFINIQLPIIKDIIFDIIDKIDVLAIPTMLLILVGGFFLNLKMMKRRTK